jgi:hypothetical protein
MDYAGFDRLIKDDIKKIDDLIKKTNRWLRLRKLRRIQGLDDFTIEESEQILGIKNESTGN